MRNETQMKSGAKYTIAAYLRISQEDKTNDESNSITNQRAIIKRYVSDREEFQGATFLDYVDDGISGSHTKREAYQRLMTDVNNGVVDCIIVKDLSRIGRNLIDVDDLIMNQLVTLGVRFVAVNNNYDSLIHPLSNLELSIISLANQHYNKDLAVKSMSAKLTKQKRGEYLNQAPFGYKKSETEKNQLVIDEESGQVVKLIFSLAVDGRRSVEIAKILNAQNIPSPSIYKVNNANKNSWHNAIDKDFCFWTNCVIRRLLMNEVYLGNAISNKSKVTEAGTGRTTPRPRDEWIIVANTHEPLVSESDFKKAQTILPKKQFDSEPDNYFGRKIRCSTCDHAMVRYTKNNPRFKCGTAKYTDHYGCQNHNILQSDIEKVVLSSIKIYAATLLDQQEIKLSLIQQKKLSVGELKSEIREKEKFILLLESSLTKIFTTMASGKITKEIFLHKKEVINDSITNQQNAIAKLQEQLETLSNGRTIVEKLIAELNPLVSLETLDKEIVSLLIDKIYIIGENEIEIVWNDRH